MNKFKEKIQPYYDHFFFIKIGFYANKSKKLYFENYKELNKIYFNYELKKTNLKSTSEKDFKSLFIRGFTKGLAYNHTILTQEEAKDLLKLFLNEFDNPKFFTNHTFENNTNLTWYPVTNYTFDLMLGAIDINKVGIILIADED